MSHFVLNNINGSISINDAEGARTFRLTFSEVVEPSQEQGPAMVNMLGNSSFSLAMTKEEADGYVLGEVYDLPLPLHAVSN